MCGKELDGNQLLSVPDSSLESGSSAPPDFSCSTDTLVADL